MAEQAVGSAAGVDTFREEVRVWLADNCPTEARGPGAQIAVGSKHDLSPELLKWRRALGERGWISPMWPTSYGGGGLSAVETGVLYDEIRRIEARVPFGLGNLMLGPTLLEFGTEDQKQRHLPGIASGEVAWCQGYSEPGAGSDLASLRTRADDKGDYFEVTGQKIWTSGADFADWMFALVRTDFDVPKHDGISFVLLDMSQPAIRTRPIQLISGSSPFCETFLDGAIAHKSDLVGEMNKGWTVGKRLLQHERSGLAGIGTARVEREESSLHDVAREYLGTDSRGRIADSCFRDEVIRFTMNGASFALTQKRVKQQAEAGESIGDTVAIFKLYGATLGRDRQDFECRLRGSRGWGWEGDGFTAEELAHTRTTLHGRAQTIYGGSNEIQMNIIAKRVLGLPD